MAAPASITSSQSHVPRESKLSNSSLTASCAGSLWKRGSLRFIFSVIHADHILLNGTNLQRCACLGVFLLDDAPPFCKFIVLHDPILCLFLLLSVRRSTSEPTSPELAGGRGSSPGGDTLDDVSRREGGFNCPGGTAPTAPMELLSPAKQEISAPSPRELPQLVKPPNGFPLAKKGPRAAVAAASSRHATGSRSSANPHGSSNEVGHTGPTSSPPIMAAEAPPPRPG